MEPNKPANASEPELKTREDVERQVVKNLSATDNPDNIIFYNLAGPGPIKEKIKVLLKGAGWFLIFAIIWIAGAVLDQVFGISLVDKNDRGPSAWIPVSSIVVIFVGLLIYGAVMRQRLRRGKWRK